MLDIEELGVGDIESADVAAITPQVIAAAFEEVVHKKCVWAQLFKVNKDILNKPGKEVIFPGATAGGAFKVGVSENTDITTVSGASVGLGAYNTVSIGVTKIGGYMNITREAVKFAMRDVIKDEIYETGLQYKEAIDDMAYNQLMYGANDEQTPSTVTFTSLSVVDLGQTNILEVVSLASDQPLTAIDYVNGKAYFSAAATGTIQFRYGVKPGLSRSSARAGTTSTGITAWGVLDAKAAMISQGRDPDVVVMNYNAVPNLLYDVKVNFLDVSAYGSNEPLYNAEVGKLWGLKVVTESRHLPNGAAVLVDKDRMGWDVHKEELTSYREDVYKKDAVSYYFYAERGFGVKDTLALALVLGGTSSYPGTHPV